MKQSGQNFTDFSHISIAFIFTNKISKKLSKRSFYLLKSLNPVALLPHRRMNCTVPLLFLQAGLIFYWLSQIFVTRLKND